MNMMSGDDLVLPPSTNKKCEKFRKPISGKAYNFSATGDKATNNIVGFLCCEVKADADLKICKQLVSAYEKCHSSVMGTGKYPETGRTHCGEELYNLYLCVNQQKAK